MKIWLVNTNSNDNNGNPNGFKFMLRQNKAAAYYDKKERVDIISPHDMVLLYHNENRIIAVGFALEKVAHDYDDIRDIEHWVDVNWIWKARFNDDFEPTNPIYRGDIGITMVNGTVVNVTNQVDTTDLLEQIGERQYF